MKVNQYINVEYESNDSIIAMTKETNRYEVDISQEQLDILVAITGSISGRGQVRKVTDDMYESMYSYATPHHDFPVEHNSLNDYFNEEELTVKRTSEANIHVHVCPNKNTVWATADQSPEEDNIKVTFDNSGKPIKVELIKG
jgi:hypothetical protein